MTPADGPIDRIKRYFRQDLAVCIDCGYQITDGSITPFCEECGAPNPFFDRNKFEEEFHMVCSRTRLHVPTGTPHSVRGAVSNCRSLTHRELGFSHTFLTKQKPPDPVTEPEGV